MSRPADRAVADSDPPVPPPSRRRWLLLTLAVAGPAAAWAFQLVAGYAVEETACSPAAHGSLLSRHAELVIALLTVAAVAAALACPLAGVRVWRATAQQDDPRGHVRFLALSGIAAAGLFTLIMVLVGGSLGGLESCHS